MDCMIDLRLIGQGRTRFTEMGAPRLRIQHLVSYRIQHAEEAMV